MSNQNLSSFCQKGRCRYSFCREEQGNISSGDLGQAERGVVVEDGGGDD